MVAVLFNPVYQSYTHMGQQQETPAHTTRVQYHMGLDQLYGSSSTSSQVGFSG